MAPRSSSLFWFAHARPADPTCATLSNAIAQDHQCHCSVVPLGFLDFGHRSFRNSDNVKDSAECDHRGFGSPVLAQYQNERVKSAVHRNQKLPDSSVCSDRKQLAVELIAGHGDVDYLGVDPSGQSYINAGTNTTFPSTDFSAQTVAGGGRSQLPCQHDSPSQKFNGSGQRTISRQAFSNVQRQYKVLKSLAL